MGKEKEENICFDNLKKKRGKYINAQLKRINNAIKVEGWMESPDFLLSDSESTYGIEHFAVDQVYLHDFKRSSGRIVDSQLWKTFNDNHEDLVSKQFKPEKALDNIQETMQLALDITTAFDYKKFMEQFVRIYKKHTEKIPRYQERMKNYDNVQLYFLIEMNSLIIPQSQGFIKCYAIRDDGAKVLVKGNRIIITHDMLGAFEKQIGVLQGIIIQQYALFDLQRDMTAEVYIDLTSREAMKTSLDIQGIDIYKSYYIEAPTCKVNFKLDKN